VGERRLKSTTERGWRGRPVSLAHHQTKKQSGFFK